MNNFHIAILISIFSLMLAMLSLGWNIYRDVILKPRLKIRYELKTLVRPGSSSRENYIVLSATNYGPGKIRCDMIHFKNQTLLNTLPHCFINSIRFKTVIRINKGTNVQKRYIAELHKK